MTSLLSSCRRAWMAGAGAFGLAGCSAAGVLDLFVPRSTYRGRADLAYGPDPRQRLDVYLPKEGEGPWPVVLFFYGGSWTTGDRADYRFVGEALASRGMVAVICDYRLSPQVRYPVFVQDCALATRWVHDQLPALKGDARRLYLMGHSAGGYNAAMLALDARWLGAVGLQQDQFAGWIGLAGPYDFLPIQVPEAQVAFNWPDTPPDSQPLMQATAAAPRTLLLAAREDKLVNPVRNTEALALRLKSLGVPLELELFDGVSHVTLLASMAAPLRRLAPVLDRVAAFAGGSAKT